VLQGLFEAGVDPPRAVAAVSVGALNGSAIAAYPSLAGVHMLRELWVSPQAAAVFRAHPLGVVLSGLRRQQVSALPQANVRRLVERAEALTGASSRQASATAIVLRGRVCKAQFLFTANFKTPTE